MKCCILWALMLFPAAIHAEPPCLILKHATTSQQFLVNASNWRYVEGEFPKGMKWKSNITDRYVRQIKAAGGIIVIIPTDYTQADVENARKQCAALEEANK
jgi:hypothetical protein